MMNRFIQEMITILHFLVEISSMNSRPQQTLFHLMICIIIYNGVIACLN